MFSWFFGVKNDCTRCIASCDRLIINICKIITAYEQFAYAGERPKKQIQSIVKKVETSILLSKRICNFLTSLQTDIEDHKEKISVIERYLEEHNVLEQLRNEHQIITVLGNKFSELRQMISKIHKTEQLLNISDGKETVKIRREEPRNISSKYITEEVKEKLEHFLHVVNLTNFNKEVEALHDVDQTLKDFVVSLKDTKGYLNVYWYEYHLLSKLVKKYKNGTRGKKLLREVFGRRSVYPFSTGKPHDPEKMQELVTKLRKTLTKDEINVLMHRLRLTQVKDIDYSMRGLSDREAQLFAGSIKKLAGPLGLFLRKDQTADGYGFIHAREHFNNLKDVITTRYPNLRSAMKGIITKPKFELKSRGLRFLLSPLDKIGRYFLVAIINPSLGFVTFYHVDNSATRSGLLNTIKMIVKNNELPLFQHKSNTRHYIVPFVPQGKSLYVIQYDYDEPKKGETSKLFITARHVSKKYYKDMLSDFKRQENVTNFAKFQERHKNKQIINLQILSA